PRRRQRISPPARLRPASGGKDTDHGRRAGSTACGGHARRPRGIDQESRAADRRKESGALQTGSRSATLRLYGGRHFALWNPQAHAGLGGGELARLRPDLFEWGPARISDWYRSPGAGEGPGGKACGSGSGKVTGGMPAIAPAPPKHQRPLSRRFIADSEYRWPATASAGNASSTFSQTSADGFSVMAVKASSTWAGAVAPQMGVASPWRRHQAMASCAGFTPNESASCSKFRTSSILR